MEADHVGLGEQLIRCHPPNPDPPRRLFGPGGVRADELHAKAFGPAGDVLPDAAEAENAEDFPRQVEAQETFPATRFDAGVGLGDATQEGEQESHGEIGDRLVVRAGRRGDHDTARRGGGDIDVIDADAMLGNDAQPGRGIHQGGVDGVEGHDPGIRLGDLGDEISLGKAAAFAPFEDGAAGAPEALHRFGHLSPERPRRHQDHVVPHSISPRMDNSGRVGQSRTAFTVWRIRSAFFKCPR